MKCPVCKTEFINNLIECPNCGFAEIRTEFLNKDEAQRWMDDTVIPCQAVYKKMSQKLQEIEKANQNADSSNKKTLRKGKKKLKYTINDIVYEDNSIKVQYIKQGRGMYLVGGPCKTATFVFENKTEERMCIFFKDISIGGFLNQEKLDQGIGLDGGQKMVEEMRMIFENKIVGNISDYKSYEFKICYGQVRKNGKYCTDIRGEIYESESISIVI